MRKATAKKSYYESSYRGVLYWILVILIVVMINRRSESNRKEYPTTAKSHSPK